MSPSLWLLSVAIALSCGPSTGAADSGESDSADRAGQVYRIVPKARIQTSYDFTGRLVILNQDVSFEVPPDYQNSFAFWTDRMKGIQKTELIQFLTVTREPGEDGTISFRKQVPRYSLETLRPGEIMAVGAKSMFDEVESKLWEGMLDAHGNVIEMHQQAGSENEDLDSLGFPILHHIFPALDGPREMRIGDHFSEVVALKPPSRLSVAGLDDVGILLTRRYRLDSVDGNIASFSMKASIESDPDRPSTRERTSCEITGEGTGTAKFDIRRGVFLSSRLSFELNYHIQAPLRRLPTQAADFDPGLGSTTVVQKVMLNGTQKVVRLMGKDED
jgi:hypothetical protein